MGLSKLASFQKAIIEDRHVSMHIVLGATKNIYIYIFIAIPTIALTKKILSSSDPHQLTFYLTYITSDIRGLHFFQKNSRMFSMITSWESLLACGRWSRTSSPFLTSLTLGLRPWKWCLETAQSGIVKVALELWFKKEANGLALISLAKICLHTKFGTTSSHGSSGISLVNK